MQASSWDPSCFLRWKPALEVHTTGTSWLSVPKLGRLKFAPVSLSLLQSPLHLCLRVHIHFRLVPHPLLSISHGSTVPLGPAGRGWSGFYMDRFLMHSFCIQHLTSFLPGNSTACSTLAWAEFGLCYAAT